jgi:hypothetical protein
MLYPLAFPCFALFSVSLEKQMPHPIQHQKHGNQNPRQLENRYLVPRLRHAAQPHCAALECCGEGGEGFGGAVDDVLVSCVVVDVDCYAPERGDFAGELVEAGVVLPRED